MSYLVVKALHLIAMVAWFAGLFYMPRIFIYSVEADAKPPAERDAVRDQLDIMGRRLWRGITWPAMIMTIVCGTWLAVLYRGWNQPWLHVKLTLILCLMAYHLMCGTIRKEIVARRSRWTSHGLRLWNEVATMLLVSIVLVAVLKNAVFDWRVPAAVFAVVAALTTGVFAYRRVRR